MRNTRVANWLAFAIMFMMALVNVASADLVQGINIDFVTIGHAGNAADTEGTFGRGAVGYNYRIGRYEISNAQWNIFTESAGTPIGNDAGYSYSDHFAGAQQPINYVSWYEAAQFCNYLTSGDKTKGAYQFSGDSVSPGNFIYVDRDSAVSDYGTVYVIPTEDEWYKAAYFKPDGSGYSLYANVKNTAPMKSEACYGQSYPYPGPWNVGSGTFEQNGTFDMMGNVWEWNENSSLFEPGINGGSFDYSNAFFTSKSRGYGYPANESYTIGFRIASVPEPATLLLLGLGGMVLVKRKAE